MTTSTKDVLRVIRIPVADVDIDHHVPHYLHNLWWQKSLNLHQVRLKDILEVWRMFPDSRLVLDGPSLQGCCLILQLCVIIPSVKLVHDQ